uniref:F-box protein n=1 Tax=Panagrolaimus sp. JU765 TaxID=591449 RepID=A0AC34RC88_9BILA
MMVDTEIIEKNLLEEQQNVKELEEQLFNEKNALKCAEMDGSGDVEEPKYPKTDSEKAAKISELERTLSWKKQNVLMLQSTKNRLLNPVSLSPSLYSEILFNVAGCNVRNICKSYNNESRKFGWKQIMLNVIKFGLSGKENIVALVQMFEHATTLNFSCDVFRFYFETKWTTFVLYNCELIGDWLVQLIKVATPNVKKIEFGKEKLFDSFFDALSKDSRQKKLKMVGLYKLDDTVTTVLQNLVEKGVRIKLDDVDKEILMELPPCEFDTLSTKNIFSLAQLKCKFRKLKFSYFNWNVFSHDLGEDADKLKIDFVEELHFKYPRDVGNFRRFYEQLKEIFPNAEKLVVEHEVRISYDYNDREHDYEVANVIDYMKEFIEEAPQNEIILTLCIYCVEHFSRLIRKFHWTKIAKNKFQCKSEINEKKIIRLEIHADRSEYGDSDYDSSGSDNDDITNANALNSFLNILRSGN